MTEPLVINIYLKLMTVDLSFCKNLQLEPMPASVEMLLILTVLEN